MGPVLPLVSTRVVADAQRGRATRWVHTALRTKTPALPEALARALSGYSMDGAALRAHLVSGGHVPAAAASPRVAAVLGTVWAALGSGPEDARAGHELLSAVVAEAPHVLTPKQRQVYAQLSFLLGEYGTVTDALDRFPDIPTDVADALRTDLLNPTVTADDRRDEWLTRLAEPFRAAGVAPVHVETGEETLFDGLRSTSTGEADGPLVTVIMPCYRPDAGLLTSVRSIAAQTHHNLEVLLVDDASGPEYDDLFSQATLADPRVRLLRMDRNGGTYRARNAALDVARGTYVTVQDADDWSHPERLAAQVRVLEREPSAGGSRSDAIRATDDLTHQWVGYAPRRRNASSLMFRRSVVEQIGPFDLVRNSGDSEYYERLVRLVGPVVDTSTPLAVTRLRAGTLSRADFSFQWMAPDRLLYRAAYRSWHESLTGTGSRPVTPTGQRAFPAPSAMLRGLPGSGTPRELDVLLVLDASDSAAVREALRLASAGGSVGALHLEDPTRGRSSRPEPLDDALAAAREGRLALVSRSDELRARTTVILTSGPLELAPRPALRIETEELLAVARPATGLRDVQDHLTLRETCRSVFGRPPRWVAASPEQHDVWDQEGWQLPLLADVLASSEPTGKREEKR